MIFVKVTSIDEVQKGFRGIFEPISAEASDVIPSLIIVPMVAFDKNVTRLGYGGGFYDRFLAHYTGYSVGLCYENCCGDVPADTYDMAVDTVITENGIYYDRK